MPSSDPPTAPKGAASSPPGAPLDCDLLWQQVVAREAAPRSPFVYAVETTGVFCRPGCASRSPRRSNVRFFRTPTEAVAAGFRACLRCHPGHALPPARALERATAAVGALLAGQPGGETLPLAALCRLAADTGLPLPLLNRAVRHLLGVSPSEMRRAARLDRFRRELRAPPRPEHASSPAPVTRALQEAGFSSPSRLYESSSATLGMTPTSLRRGAPGELIHYVLASSALGDMLVAATARGVCAVSFGDTEVDLLADLHTRFPRADLRRSPPADSEAETGTPGEWLHQAVRTVLSRLTEHPLAVTFPLDLRATAFQLRVWKALQTIPRGETLTYTGLACRLGQPSAARAVSSACAANPLAVLQPCHRVVGARGALTGYRWGLERKRALLEGERPASGNATFGRSAGLEKESNPPHEAALRESP